MESIVILSYRQSDTLFDVEAIDVNGNLQLLEIFAADRVEAEQKAEESGYEVYQPRVVNRPGDMAAIYAEENGVDYASALVACNMD